MKPQRRVTLREGLIKGRSHLLVVVVMIVTAVVVIALENDTLTRETGKPGPDHALEGVPGGF